MAKRCPKCGNFLMDDETFCTRCGENVVSVPEMGGEFKSTVDNGMNAGYGAAPGYTDNMGYGAQPQYGQPQQQYGQPQYTVNNNTQAYNRPVQQADEMSVGSWIGTILVTTLFGIISIILLFVWGFGSSGPESRRRYCKAMLVVDLIGLIIGIIVTIIFAVAFATVWPEIWPQIREALRENGYIIASSGLFM